MSTVQPTGNGAWEREAQRADFSDSIQENINTLEKTISSGGRVSIDFFRILQKDVTLLRNKYQREMKGPNSPEMQNLGLLNMRLQRLAAQYQQENPDLLALDEDQQVPLARSPMKVSQAYQPAEMRFPQDLDKLLGCSVMRIRGDGHCLFRAIAAHLLTAEHLEHLMRNADRLQPLLPQGFDLKALITTSRRRLEDGEPVHILLADEAFANRWILALRNIAVRAIAEGAVDPQVFLSDARVTTGLTDDVSPADVLREYARRMSSLEQGVWGGQSEIIALARALNLPIHVVDLQTPPDQREGPLLPEAVDLSHIFLLRRIGHYDVLYPGRAPSIDDVD